MKYTAIAIEREYGSGGREVGKKLADLLSIPCYGREILEIAAHKYGRRPEDFEKFEEKATNSFMYSLFLMTQVNNGREERLSENDRLSLAESEVIKDLRNKGRCIFVGRGAVNVLKDDEKVLKVFIHADNDSRMERAVNQYGDSRSDIKKKLEKMDRRRENYFNSLADVKWRDTDTYHMILDSGKLGTDGCVRAIASFFKE